MNKWVIAAVVLFAAVNGAAAAGSQSGPLQKEKETGQPVVPGTKGDERAIGTTPDRLERLERPRLEDNPARSESTGQAPRVERLEPVPRN